MAPRWGGLRPEPYDPDARDADGDGIVQEQTAWERPVGTNLVDELGRAITRGTNSGTRPRGMRVVGRDGKDVDYTPTYGKGPAGGKPGAATALSDHGAGSLGERGIPTVGEGLGKREGTSVRAITNPNPEPPKTEKPVKPKPPTEEKVVEGANPAGFTSTSADRPELTETQKPRSPYKPSPPPLAGRAQELADEAEGDFKKFKELLDKEGYVVFDYETTGLQDGNIPVQIGAVRMKDGEIVERFNVFTNPRRPLSQWSKDNLKDKDGNPLTDEWLEGQTSLDEAHKQMAAFLGDSIIVAHNLPYDGEIIERMMKDADIDYKPSGSIDTLMLLRSAVPKGEGEDGPERHTLGALADFFDVDLGDAAHTADADSEAAALVLAKAMDWADRKKSDPEIFDATKQKELFDSATKKYDDQRKKYEADLDKYRSDMEEYQRSIAKADDVVSAAAPPQPEPEKPAGQPSAPEKPEVPEAKTTSIPAGMSGGGMQAKSFYYGDEEWEVFDGDLDPVDAADAAYSMWSGYDGNFQMRHVSAALMGQETPAAYGDEIGPKEINQILSTGKWEGQPEWAKEQAKESVQWATFIMDQVVNGEKTERPLYRGLSDVPDDADILNYKPGDTFTIPLSAFSPDQRLAEQFATGTGEGKSVVIVVEPGARGYKSPEGYETQFEENGKWVEDSMEYVTNGDFEVVRTQNARGQTIVTIRHLQTYNSSGSKFSVKAEGKPKKRIPTWAWTFAGGSIVKRAKPNVRTRLGGKRTRKGSNAK